MDTPLPEASDTASSPAKAVEASFVPPGVELIEHIGSGGMGSVYKARHIAIDSTIAVKILPRLAHSDTASLRRFQREGQILAALKHPNIVRVLSVASQDDRHAMIMEHVEGVPLSTVLKEEGALAPERAQQLLAQAATALAYAHGEKVIHRDLKPSNMLICKHGGEEVIKLIDFGIARALDDTQQRLTRTGSIIGTPAYISPEQCSGQRGDERSDIYSLGCVLYECLSGLPPFGGETAFEVMHKHLTEAPPELKEAPASLNSVVQRALAKDPADRYQTMSDFSHAISHGETGSVRRKSKRAWAAGDLRLAAAIAMSCALLLLLAYVMRYRHEMESPIPKDVPFRRLWRIVMSDADHGRLSDGAIINELKTNSRAAAFDDLKTCGIALSYAYNKTHDPRLLECELLQYEHAVNKLHNAGSPSGFEPRRIAATLKEMNRLEDAPGYFISELKYCNLSQRATEDQKRELHAGLAAVYEALGRHAEADTQRRWLARSGLSAPQIEQRTSQQVLAHTLSDGDIARTQ